VVFHFSAAECTAPNHRTWAATSEAARSVGEVPSRDLLGRERFAQKRIQYPGPEQKQVMGARQRSRGHLHRGDPALSNRIGQRLRRGVIVTDQLIVSP